MVATASHILLTWNSIIFVPLKVTCIKVVTLELKS